MFDKGKPSESVGRKATGPSLRVLRYGSRAAGRDAASPSKLRFARLRAFGGSLYRFLREQKTQHRSKKANHLKGWDAKPLA